MGSTGTTWPPTYFAADHEKVAPWLRSLSGELEDGADGDLARRQRGARLVDVVDRESLGDENVEVEAAIGVPFQEGREILVGRARATEARDEALLAGQHFDRW
jgi:hypothetical protein